MQPKREILATALSADELLPQQEQRAQALGLRQREPNDSNAWGPIFSNHLYDLRIDKQGDKDRFALLLLHKSQPPRSLLDRLMRRGD